LENNIDSYKILDGKKIMWDGSIYEDEVSAQEKESDYKENGFETWILEEEGKYLVYTRREVTEIVVEGGGGI